MSIYVAVNEIIAFFLNLSNSSIDCKEVGS